MAVSTALRAPRAIAQQRRKVVVAYGSSAIAPDINFSTSVPIGAGFFADEGLAVEVVSVNISATAMTMNVSDRAQFAATATNSLFSAIDQGFPIQSFICQVPDSYYSVAVLQDSKINRPSDLRGRVLGVPTLAGGTILLLKVALRGAGLDPNRDVEFVGVGSGLPALDALQRDRVQALFLWDEPFSLFEANGAQLRHFAPDPIPRLGFTFGTHTTLSMIEKEPALVAAMARALARSLVFCAAAEVEELCKLHSKVFPEARSSAVSAPEDLRITQIRVKNRLSYMRLRQRVFERSERLGDESDARITLGRDLLLSGGELKQKLPLDRYFTRKFVAEMNRVDVAAIIEQARAFRA